MVRIKLDKRIKNLGDDISYKYPWLRKYLKPLYHKLFKDRYYSKRRDALLSKSYDVIERFDKSLSESGIQYSLGFGSMLGAVREHGIIGHDADMDTLIWAENDNFKLVKESLERAGFVRTRCFLIENGKLGREETYEYNSVPIDIFYIYPPVDELPYTAYYIPVEGYRTPRISMKEAGRVQAIRLDRPYEKEYIKVPFGPLMLPIMKHYDPILKACYGEHYMVPDPNYKRTHATKWIDVHAIME